MDRFACREQILKDLKADGLLAKVEPYTVPVGHCYRCKTVVEPLVSKQWFVAVKTLADGGHGRGGRRPHPAASPPTGTRATSTG